MPARVSIVSVLGAVVCALLAPQAAGASPPHGNGRGQPIYGNIVGSPDRDRATLGFDGQLCTVTVQAGIGGGRYGAPRVHEYRIPGMRDQSFCPNMGVTVRRKHARIDDLVVTWFVRAPGPAHAAWVLRHLSVLTGADAQVFPSLIGSQDFNGDRAGDLWESSDEGEGFTTYLRHGDGYVAGPAAVSSFLIIPSVAFGHLDNTPGTDAVVGYRAPTDSGAVVVFGSTGAKVVLESDPSRRTVYTVAVLDANGDGHQDVQVSGGSQPPRVYLGDGAGHFTRSVSP